MDWATFWVIRKTHLFTLPASDRDDSKDAGPASGGPRVRPPDALRFFRAFKETFGQRLNSLDMRKLNPALIGATKIKEALKSIINKQVLIHMGITAMHTGLPDGIFSTQKIPICIIFWRIFAVQEVSFIDILGSSAKH
jgi:hypothetical protein